MDWKRAETKPSLDQAFHLLEIGELADDLVLKLLLLTLPTDAADCIRDSLIHHVRQCFCDEA